MLRHRILTAVVGLPLLIAIIWYGEPWFTILIAVMAALGSWEFYRMATQEKIKPITYFGLTWVILFILSPHCPYPVTTPLLISSAIVFPLILLLFRSVLSLFMSAEQLAKIDNTMSMQKALNCICPACVIYTIRIRCGSV